MIIETNQGAITTSISDDGMQAVLRIPVNADPKLVTVGACQVSMQQAGVAITRKIEQTLKQAVAGYAQNPEIDGDLEITFDGTQPQPGEDGRLEWAEGCDPHDLEESTQNHQVDFYNQDHFILVKPGQRIARIIPPTTGEVGYDIRGKEIAPKAGSPAPVKANPNSIAADTDGVCEAIIAGVLHFRGSEISVSPVLQVGDYVDFSTGNIRFSGDVIVRRGVRDRFSVEARGNLETGELIEAANITTGGDLLAKGGIASKNAGGLTIGRDLIAKYVEGARGEVARDAIVDREIIQSNLSIGHELRVQKGALIGGTTSVAATTHLAELGSPGEQKTLLILGFHHAMEAMIQRTSEHLSVIEEKIREAIAESQRLQALSAPTPEEREKMTEMMYLPIELNEKKEIIIQKQKELRQRYDKLRRVDLSVSNAIHPKACIVYNNQMVEFTGPILGPVWIGTNPQNQLIARIGGVDSPARPIQSLPGTAIRSCGLSPS